MPEFLRRWAGGLARGPGTMGLRIAVVGAGSTYTPELVDGFIRRMDGLPVDELALMDPDLQRLEPVAGLTQRMLDRAGSPTRLAITDDRSAALDGADFVIIQLRIGGQAARHVDETLPHRFGVLGQETTGPAGFGMALRNVPAILGYAELLDTVSPGAWLFNFTNPAGLVVQALRNAGIERTVGICDSANTVHRGVAAWLGVAVNSLRPEVFGLNHLSWTRCVRQDGTDRLASLLRDPAFIATTHLRMYEPDLLADVGMAPNEYLYYFYYAERALADILGEERTRGEEVAAINRAIEGIPPERVRLHCCWGNWDGPHIFDVPLELILPVLYQANVGALSIEMANPRHQHEIETIRRLPLPPDKVLIPGVVDTTTNIVEHPEVVARRIQEAVEAVGDRERVIAGADCGFGTFTNREWVIEPAVWLKLKSIREGADIASARLWDRGAVSGSSS